MSGCSMPVTRLFTNGNCQVVRLPKEFRFEGDEVVIRKIGAAVVLYPKHYREDDLKALLAEMGPPVLKREQPSVIDQRDFDM
jgi:antitoxin VapB